MANKDKGVKPGGDKDGGDDAIVVEGEVVRDEGRGDISKTPPSRLRQKLPWILVGLLSVFISGLYAAPWMELGLRKIAPTWFPEEQVSQIEGASQQDVAALGQRIERLEAGLAGLRADLVAEQARIGRLAADTATGAAERLNAIEVINQRVVALEEALSAIDVDTVADAVPAGTVSAGIDASVYEARIADLEARIDRLATEAVAPSESAPSDGLALALARLMRSADLGRPYRAEYLEMAARLPALPSVPRLEVTNSLTAIEPFAAEGIPTLDHLIDEFEALVSRSYVASLAPEEEAPWWQRLWAGTRDAVVIRKTGEAEGQTVEAILGRAEARMAERKLAATIAELGGLSGGSGAVFQDWLTAATARLSVVTAIEDIDRVLSSRSPLNRATNPVEIPATNDNSVGDASGDN